VAIASLLLTLYELLQGAGHALGELRQSTVVLQSELLELLLEAFLEGHHMLQARLVLPRELPEGAVQCGMLLAHGVKGLLHSGGAHLQGYQVILQKPVLYGRLRFF